jgi:hypothetical protein
MSPGAVPFALAEVAAREDRDAGAREPQQQQEERRQRVQPQVERKVGQADGEDRDLRRVGQARQPEGGERHAHRGRQREQDAGDDLEVAQRGDSGQADAQPGCHDDQDTIDRQQPDVHTVSTEEFK